MKQQELFDDQICYECFNKPLDPVIKHKDSIDIDGEVSRPALEALRNKSREFKVGCKPYNPLLMFKVFMLQSLYNLSDDSMEYQICDRLSLHTFPGSIALLSGPDTKTI